MTDRYYIKYVRDVYYYCGVEIVGSVKGALAHYGDYVSHDCPALRQDGAPALRVEGGSYGAVALLMALLHPDTTVVAVAANDDDAAVCRNVACRIVGNIIIENG